MQDDEESWRGASAHNSRGRHRGRGRGRGHHGYQRWSGHQSGADDTSRGGSGYHANSGYGNHAESWDNRGPSSDHQDTGRGHSGHPRGLRGKDIGMYYANKGREDRGGRHPAHLKGRDIGLFYAKKSREKNDREERKMRQYVQMDSKKERHLSNLLASIRSDAPSTSTSTRPVERVERVEPARHTGRYFDSGPVPDAWDDPDPMAECSSGSLETADAHGNHGNQAAAESSNQGNEPVSDSDSDDSDSDMTRLALEAERRTENYGAVGRGSEVHLEDDALVVDAAAAAAHEEEEEDNSDLEVDASQVTELFHYNETESEFITEFREHNAANRRSLDRLSDIDTYQKIVRDPDLDRKLVEEQQYNQQNPQFQSMLRFRKKLPSYNMRKDLLDVIHRNQVVVISGETGCGKTTQVPQFILDDFIERGQGSTCRIVCTQPRRISAISVAERVANERAEPCGEGSVGYQIRLEQKMSRQQGSMLYCTTGILLKYLASDLWLSRTTHVILDEIHERDLLSDFLMIILKDLIVRRKDLKLILMSATLNAEMFSQYFGNCPMVNIPGYTYPVKEYLLEDVVEMTCYHQDRQTVQRRPPRAVHGKRKWEQRQEEECFNKWLGSLGDRYSHRTKDALHQMDFSQIDLDLAATLIDYIVSKRTEGAILVFMPGWEQIRTLHGLLTKQPKYNSGAFRIIPLHSMMPTVNQKEVFDRPPPGVRKIVIATNIAETSITIDDVVYVIDCGKIKMKNFDAEHNIATLQPEWVSRANARQRRGRAGRVQAGECYHMYTAYHEASFADYQQPEMLRTRLEELCLQIKLLKLGKIVPFVNKAMQTPPMEALRLAVQTLMDLNALDEGEELTPLGYHLAKMPVDPHTGKMLLFAAMFCCLDPVLTVAASLSFKDAFYIPLGRERLADQKRRELAADSKSDHIMLVNAYKGWERAKRNGNTSHYCWEYFLSSNILKMLQDMRNQFVRLLHEMGFVGSANATASSVNKNSDNWNLVKAVVCAGLYPNVAKMRNVRRSRHKPVNLSTKTERAVRIHPKSVNVEERDFSSPWMIYHLKMKTTKIYLYDCTMVSYYPLLFFGGNISVRKDQGDDCIVVDDWIVFRASRRTAKLVKELRYELDKLLEYKITHPGITSWNPQDKEGALMRAIADLLTTEPDCPDKHFALGS